MILVGASAYEAALPFEVVNGSGAMVPAYAFPDVGGGLTNEFQFRLPGGAYTNATIANIEDLGNGNYQYKMTSGNTATAGKVFYRTNITGYENYARWEDIINIPASSAIADAVWDEVMENGKTARQWMRGIKAALWARVVYGTNSRAFRDDADTKNRIVATVDDSGRYGITEDLT